MSHAKRWPSAPGRLLAVGTLVLASCKSAPAESPTVGDATETAVATETAAATETAVASGTTGRTCVSSSEGPEVLCELDSGTYNTEFLQPALTYTVPSAGWGSLNRAASPGNFHLFPPGATLAGFEQGTSDDITMLSAVVPPGQCTGEPSAEHEQTFDGLMEFLTTNPNVVVSHVEEVSVGGWDGTMMDIAFAASDGCPDGEYVDLMVGVSPSHGPFGITPDMAGIRLYLLHDPTTATALAISIDDAADGGSDYGDGDDWYGPAQGVVDTFVFTP